MLFKERFQTIKYPKLLDTFDDLHIETLPPWDLIGEGYELWQNFFNSSNLPNYIPFAKMINDDVVATFDSRSEKIYLFLLPVTSESRSFKTYNNTDEWLKRALEDVLEYLVNY